jgi:hypothetical protein
MDTTSLKLETNVFHHEIIKKMCDDWIILEKSIAVKGDDIPHIQTWRILAQLSIFDLEDCSNFFNNIPNEDFKILTRFTDLYVNARYSVGGKAIEHLRKELRGVLKEFGVKDTNRVIKTYPFIVLVPVLNSIYLNHI